MQAMDEIMEALAVEDGAEAEQALKHAVRRLYLALICHTVGSVPFQSPVLSFCAMLSRKVRGKGRGLWEEPGNFNSHLSVLTWTAQLVLAGRRRSDPDLSRQDLQEVLLVAGGDAVRPHLAVAALLVQGGQGGYCQVPSAVVLGRADRGVLWGGAADVAGLGPGGVRMSLGACPAV
ncbi:telomere-associated recq protein [Rutstroemia sp. NJR-2017a WRK4]|nr:telomere-associated recq protein [Rutstroemia sp. NJR-2017a WRK4]